MPESFLTQALQAAQSLSWVTHIEHQTSGRVVRLKLFLDSESFVAVYYNADTGSTSYALVEQGQRLFGANNMKIGWHIHPWGQEDRHIRSEPVSIEEFLKRLEKALREHHRL